MSIKVLKTRIARTVGRRLLDTLARSLAAPSATPVADLPVPNPAALFAADELPPLADIEAAAEQFFAASEQTRHADRTKRAARKILDRLPAGLYGGWLVERVANAREVVDVDAVRAVFKAHGLGAVPMKGCAPSLKVGFAPETAQFLAKTAGGAA
ncbi:MAG TPA: hypothetical protein VK547_09635 [Candidatus Udaeobacter sp.]|nr:hypothetical protein [Candidatus Udaeobacter sp.]